LGLIISLNGRAPQSEHSVATTELKSVEIPAAVAVAAQPENRIPQATAPVASDFRERLEKIQLPSLESFREEVKLNPHQPSVGLIKASRDLNEMRQSAHTMAEAALLFAMLEKCVRDQRESPVALQAGCLRQSLLLSKSYPELQERYESLRQQASAGAVKFSDFVGKF
jgi:hypothetical protein